MLANSGDPKRPDAWLYVDELSHRALNDYTAMLATVARAARTVTDPIGLRALRDVEGRLRAGAATHNALRPPRRNTSQRLDLVLEGVCEALSQSVLAPRGIELLLFCEPIALDAVKCWRVALVVSELVRNAARHAFVEGERGEVRVELREVFDGLRCMVADNGCAPEQIQPGRGSAILDGLANDLDAVIVRRYGATGSTVNLTLLGQGVSADVR